MSRTPSRSRARAVLLAVTALAVALAGCGSDSTDAPDPAATGAASSLDLSATLDAAYTGVVGAPTTAPATPAPGKSIWIVSCGQRVGTCATPAEAAVEAAQAVGWTAKICDGQLNPAGWAACIRQGISAKADAILQFGQDCSSFRAPLQEAKKAGIVTIGIGGNDCDIDGGAKEFTATTQKLPDLSSQQWYNTMGQLQAKWIIAKTAGKAQVLSIKFTDTSLGPWVQEGFEKEIATCAGCKVVKVLDIGNQDVGGGTLTTKFSTALLQNPTVNAVNVPIDGWFLAGLAQALQASGRSDKLAVIGAFGEPGNLDFIRNGNGQDASVAFSLAWDGWAGIDATIRTFNKQPLEPQGIGLQVVDKDKNLPAAGQRFSYQPSQDFVSAYKTAWGL